MRTMFILNE